jgi:hypothetical protein
MNKYDIKNLETVSFPMPIGKCEAYFNSFPLDEIRILELKEINEAWHKSLR